MKRLNLFLAAALFVALAPAAEAYYGRSMVSFGYDWSAPMGDTKDYIDNDSWIGFALRGEKAMNDNVSVGFLLAWNEFYIRTKELIPLENGALYGDQYRDLNSFPMMLTARYQGSGNGRFNPFIGAGAGVFYLHQVLDIGASTLSTDNWIMGFTPEAGVQFRLRSGAEARLTVRYNLPLNAGEFMNGDSRSMQYLSVGVSFLGSR